MKNIALIIMSLIAIYCVHAVAGEARTGQGENKVPGKILIAYYSWSDGKNTKAAAELIQKNTGGEIFQIKPVTAYPRRYKDVAAMAKKELAAGTKPKIESFSKDIAEYDVVFIGSPIWYGTYAPPVATFLSELNLSGKTVVPFSTHGGGGSARYSSSVVKLCPKSKVLAEFTCRGSNIRSEEKNIVKWLNSLKLAKP